MTNISKTSRVEELAKWYCKEMGWRWDLLHDIALSPISPPSKKSFIKLARNIVEQVEFIWCKEILDSEDCQRMVCDKANICEIDCEDKSPHYFDSSCINECQWHGKCKQV